MTEQERLNKEATETALRIGRQMMTAFDTIFASTTPQPKPNPERLQKRCPDCFGTGRVDFFDGETPMSCQLCGGEGMLP